MAALFLRKAQGTRCPCGLRTRRSGPCDGVCQVLQCFARCGPKDYTVTLIMGLMVRA